MTDKTSHSKTTEKQANAKDSPSQVPAEVSPPPPEVGGPKGLEPTRYGDWEKGGRCIDF